jgi:hypothetical protein
MGVIIQLNMTEKYFLSKTVKIRVPRIIDDPILGRVMAPTLFPFDIVMWIYNEYITIENGILTHKGSIMSGRTKRSFQLKDIVKLMLEKREVSCFDKEGKLNIWGRLGTEIEISLVDTKGKRYILISRFMLNNISPFMGKVQKEWDNFISDLCKYSGLPLEEMSLS